MKTIDRYIASNVVGSTMTVLLALLAIFTFFAFIDELEEVGRGSYGIMQALLFVAMSAPGLAYELFPMAALIGSLLGLGTMVGNGEITVIRCAGVSKLRVVFAVMRAGALFVALAVLIGEFVAPPAEAYARQFRSSAINDRVALKTRNGFWARDSNSYINIREILPGNQIKDIYIYEFDDESELRTSTHAAQARHLNGKWILEGIAQTIISVDGIEKREIEQAAWDSLLQPDLIAMVAIQPDALSAWTLVKYIRFLKSNGQTAERYEQALWIKVTYPLASAVMVFLSIPMVLRANRSSSVGQRVLTGGLIGLGFHLVNQAAGHLGLVFDIAPIVSASAPAVLMSVIGTVMLVRTA
ncbi:MAG: lipopolysaccharide export system permease protein [Gammaproteobacteria bacterium]|jgi:lipopolysaccharide export system permease protein